MCYQEYSLSETRERKKSSTNPVNVMAMCVEKS